MNYYKIHWDETTGDDIMDSWGTSIYYFEVDADHYPTRQVQIFQNGNALKYHENHIADKYGGLGDQPLNIEELEEFRIDQSEFENIWATIKYH